MKILMLFLLVFYSLIWISCEPQITTIQSNEQILIIRHRLYKGECIGYCDTQLIIDSTHVSYNKKGWDSKYIELPEIDTVFNIEKNSWLNLSSLLDIESIFLLDTLYPYDDSVRVSEGYIIFEINTSKRYKKIKFNVYKHIQPLDSINKELIKIRGGL